MLITSVICEVAEQLRKQAILPLTRRHGDVAVKLIPRHSLRVVCLDHALLPKLVLRVHQNLPDTSLAGARHTEQEHRPAHFKDLAQLCDLQDEHVLRLQVHVQRALLGHLLEVQEPRAGH